MDSPIFYAHRVWPGVNIDDIVSILNHHCNLMPLNGLNRQCNLLHLLSLSWCRCGRYRIDIESWFQEEESLIDLLVATNLDIFNEDQMVKTPGHVRKG